MKSILLRSIALTLLVMPTLNARMVKVPILGELNFEGDPKNIDEFLNKGVDAGKMTLQVAQNIKFHNITIIRPRLTVSPTGFPDKRLGPGYEIVGDAQAYGRKFEGHIYLTMRRAGMVGRAGGSQEAEAPEPVATGTTGAEAAFYTPTQPSEPAEKGPSAVRSGAEAIGFNLFFEGQFYSKEPFRPFKDVPVPLLKDISMRDPKVILEVSATGAMVAVQGTTDILGVTIIGTAGTLLTPEKKVGMVLKGTLPQTWKVPKPLDGLNITNASVIVSSMAYTDRDLRLSIRRGIGFYGELQANTKHFSNLTRLLRKELGSVRVYGNVGTHLRDLVIMGALPFKLDFGRKSKRLHGADVFLEVTGKPSVALICTLYVQPTPKDQVLAFSARIMPDLVQGKFAGTMVGTWTDPLGIKGLELSDMAIQGAISWFGGWPSELGLIGSLKIGSKKVKMGINVAADVRNIAAVGQLNALGTSDLIALSQKMGARKIAGIIPKADIKDVSIRIAPLGSRIGEIAIEPGVTMKGFVDLFGKRGGVDINVDLMGVRLKGFLPEISFPGFKLSGAGPDKRRGTADDGPIVDWALTLQKQHYFVSGLLKVLGIERYGEVHIGTGLIYFNLGGKIFNLFSADMRFEAKGGLKSPDFHVKGVLKNDFTTKFEGMVEQVLKKLRGQKAFAFTFKMQEAAFEGRLADLHAGLPVKLYLKYEYKGKPGSMAINYNFKRPIQNIAKIAGLLAGEAKQSALAVGTAVLDKINDIKEGIKEKAGAIGRKIRERRERKQASKQ